MSIAVLIVGASTTGLTLACELQRRGIPLRIIDKNAGIPATSRAAGVHARSLEILADLGVRDDFYALGEPIHAMNFYVGGQHVKRHVFPALDRPFPYNVTLPQYETERLLLSRFVELGGAVERQTTLKAMEERPGGLGVTLHTADGSTERFDVPWVIGCDGAHSTVRHLNHQHFPGEVEEHCYLVADIVLEGDFPRNEICQLASEQGTTFTVPLPGGRYQVAGNWHRLDAHDPAVAPDLGHVQALIDERLTARGVARDPAWISEYRVHYRLTPNYRHGRTFLAGDAAHVHSPFGGRGMNSGIQDAHNLAWKLAMVLKGDAPQALLDTYESERRPTAAANLKWTRETSAPFLRFGEFDADTRQNFVVALQAEWSAEEAVGRHLAAMDLDIVYPPSMVARSHVRDAERHKAFLAGPPPGAVAVSAGPLTVDGQSRTLADLLQGTHYTLLAFTGAHATPHDIEKAVSLAEGFAARFPGILRGYAVVVGEGASAAPHQIQDVTGVLHAIYGAQEPGLYLFRPDGRVGFRSQPPGLVPLRSFLDNALSCAALAPSTVPR